MAIHHATVKRAEANGIILTEVDGLVEAVNHQYGVRVKRADAKTALNDCITEKEQRQRAEHEGPQNDDTGPEDAVRSDEGDEGLSETLGGPLSDEAPLDDSDTDPVDANQSGPVDQPALEVERLNGIATNGAIAYAEGTPAGDCPYSSEASGDNMLDDGEEYENFVRWNDEWDAAADEAEPEEEKEASGSVVKDKFRAKYKEMGHPTHCGDWLADKLNGLVQNNGGTNLELFEAICGANGVDTSKYKRTGRGWEGRLRMTGRNLLARKVYAAEGKLMMPDTFQHPTGYEQAPTEWMEQQRYKLPKKAD